MWEDFLVRGVMARKASIVDVDGKLQRQKEKIVMLIRIGEIRDWICRHQDSKISWWSERGQAYVRKEEAGIDKKNVMKHMAELWLREEVKELEKEAGKEGGYVVIDGQALSSKSHLQLVKRT